jgi:ADP-heptose:LPS heptosyltransferase
MPANDVPRILVIRRRYLGDIVLLGSFFANLRAHWPRAELCALVEGHFQEVLALNPNVDRVIPLPRDNRSLGPWISTARQLRAGRFTHVFDLDNREKTALLTRLTGAPFRAALLHEGIKPHFLPLYTTSVVDPKDLHEQRHITEFYLTLLQTAQVPIRTRDVTLRLRDADRVFAHELLTSLEVSYSQPRLLVHPGSRSAFRQWPAERFAQVIDRAQRELNVRAVLVGGPADQEFIARIRSFVTTPAALIGQTLSVPQFAAVAAACEVLLCHDSGPMHIAAAAGARVVALLGSQNAVLFAPLGRGHTVLQAPLPCGDCIAPSVCKRADSYFNYCVQRISTDEVWAALKSKFSP